MFRDRFSYPLAVREIKTCSFPLAIRSAITASTFSGVITTHLTSRVRSASGRCTVSAGLSTGAAATVMVLVAPPQPLTNARVREKPRALAIELARISRIPFLFRQW